MYGEYEVQLMLEEAYNNGYNDCYYDVYDESYDDYLDDYYYSEGTADNVVLGISVAAVVAFIGAITIAVVRGVKYTKALLKVNNDIATKFEKEVDKINDINDELKQLHESIESYYDSLLSDIGDFNRVIQGIGPTITISKNMNNTISNVLLYALSDEHGSSVSSNDISHRSSNTIPNPNYDSKKFVKLKAKVNKLKTKAKKLELLHEKLGKKVLTAGNEIDNVTDRIAAMAASAGRTSIDPSEEEKIRKMLNDYIKLLKQTKMRMTVADKLHR